jgi:signal transduction histidine kinase/DNA-binding response OmpR family regulator
MNPLRHRFSIRVQLLALFCLLLATGFSVLVLDELALRAEIATFHSLRDESLTGLRLAKSISDTYRLDIVDTTFRVRNNLLGWDQGISVIDTAQADIDHDWLALLATNLSPEERALTDEVAKARVMADAATRKLRTILKAQDIGALGKFADTEMYPAMDPVTNRLQFLTDVKMLDAERSVHEHLARAHAIGWWRIAISLAALLFVIVVGRGILRNVYKGIGRLVHLARHARDRDFVPPGGFDHESELGQIHTALMAMRQDLLGYENELMESEARALNASRAKSSFLASMSHEIRTPMVGVASMLELLAQTRLDADQRQQIEIVQNSAQSLLQIIGDILDFSKIEAGKLELSPTPTNLRALVRTSTNNFLATASSKALKLECTIDERIGPAHLADALRLRQILSNFLSNGLKFTERGGIEVSLERLAVEGQRELIALRVRDTGIGISAADQAKLFQPFAQADDGGAKRADSTGLGLSICRRLAELMGGEIVLESRLGVGTTMSLIVRLPLADAAALVRTEYSAVASPLRAAPSVADAAREGSLILLADDHPTNRAVIARQLNQLGYACETANDGEAALQLWKSGQFSLLLTDLHMPRRDGYALAEAIRTGERTTRARRAPIVAMSANVSTEEVERSRAAGIDDFLAKPTPLALLANALERYLPLSQFAAAQMIATATAQIPAVVKSVVAEPALDRELLRDFLQSTQQDLIALNAALTNHDAAAAAHEAHRIKGASGLVSATALAACAARIEAAARAGTLEGARADADELAAEVRRFAGTLS